MESIEMVREFHEVFGHDIANMPSIPPPEQMEFRSNFIKEELEEILLGFNHGSLIEIADGLGDIQYVLDGWFLNAGLHNKKTAIMAEIHRSNMTKLCSTWLEAQETIGRQILKDGETSTYKYHTEETGNGKFIVRRNDTKIIKSYKYSPPNLDPIING